MVDFHGSSKEQKENANHVKASEWHGVLKVLHFCKFWVHQNKQHL
jgi:N-methylhydantoinase B/oxoprolinase/acetone carboxylase alpha subunit